MDAVVDRLVVGRKHEKAIKAAIAATLLVGDGLLQVHVVKGASKAEAERFYRGLCSPTHHFVYGDIEPEYFMFNNPESACRTCGGLGVHKLTHPELLVPDPQAEHPRRLLRTRGVQVQPGHLGRADDVQPGEGARLLARHAVGEAARSRCARRSWTASTREDRAVLRRRRRRRAATTGRARRSASAASPGGSSGNTADTASGARPTPAWRPGSTSVMVEHTCPDCNGARVRATRLLLHRSRARRSTNSASSTSTSCTRSSAPSSRPAAAPTPAGRCSRRSAAGSSCSWASASTT